MNQINKFPKKSASILILKEVENSVSSLFNYKVMLLKRGKNLSFSNVYAFPGGRLDANDVHKSKIHNINKYILCAVRETFEETGLLLSQEQFQDKNQLFSKIIKVKQHFRDNNFDSQNFQAISQQISPEYRKSEIKEFIRLVTAPFLPARYDTQFYINIIKKDNDFSHINWRQFLKTNDSEDLLDFQHLDYCQKEAADCKWLNPADALIEFQNKKIELAIPQRMILNILCSFPKIQQLQKFLNKKTVNPVDKLQENPFTFPYLFAGIRTQNFNQKLATNFPYTLCMPGDALYPLDLVISQEKEPELQNELISKYSSLDIKEQNNSRIHMPKFENFFANQYEVDIKQVANTPFNYLKNSIQLSNILKLQSDLKSFKDSKIQQKNIHIGKQEYKQKEEYIQQEQYSPSF